MSLSEDDPPLDRLEMAAVRILNDELPIPVRERWQPLRMGLMNLFLFEDERFPFADGRLLLRGSNGTGKSRVLAMTLPLLLDGSFKPTRVEPDRDSNRQVAWNLLMDDQSSATGYSWLEFGRIGEEGSEHFVTIGCGMRAKRGQPIKPWFFITEHRVDDSLCLQSADGVPLTRKQLNEAIEGRGQVFETAAEYRRGVDETLFRLGERYDPLIDLLLQLRQPQLAKKLNIDQLELALRESLPPLPEALLDDAAEAFRDLDHYRKSLESDRQTVQNVEKFLKPYRDHVARGVKRALRDLTSANSQYGQAQRDLRQLTAQKQEQESGLEKIAKQQSDLKIKIAAGHAAINELQRSPEMEKAEKLDSEMERAKRLGSQETDEQNALDYASKELTDVTKNCANTEASVNASRISAVSQSHQCRIAAAPEELQNKHDEIVTALLQQKQESEFSAAKKKITSVAKRFQSSASHLIEANKKLAAIEADLQEVKREVGRSENAQLEADESLTLTKHRFKEMRIETWEKVLKWIENTASLIQPFLPLTELWHDQWHDWPADSQDTDPSTPLIDNAKLSSIGELTIQRERLTQQIEILESSLIRLNDERERRLAGELAAPPIRSHRVSNESHDADAPRRPSHESTRKSKGLPFWSLVDFKTSVPESERGNWESALHDAGILDAVLTPDGQVIAFENGDEIQIVPAGLPPLESNRQLSQVVEPSSDLHNSPKGQASRLEETLKRVLSVIGVGEGAGAIWVAHDGCWQNGPLHGKLTKPEPQYIGEQSRQRWRDNRIRNIESETKSHRASQVEFESKITGLEEAQKQIERLTSDFPSSERLVDANKAESNAQRDLDAACENARTSREKESKAQGQLDEATKQRNADATDMGLIAWADRAAELRLKIDGYISKLAILDSKVDVLLSTIAHAKHDQVAAEQSKSRREHAADRLNQTQTELAKAQETVKVLQASVGQSVTEVIARLEKERQAQNDRESRYERLSESHSDLKADSAVAANNLEIRETESEQFDDDRKKATDWFSMLHENSLLELVVDPAEIPDLPWTMTAAIKLARSVNSQLGAVPDDLESWQRSQSTVHKSQNELQQTVFSQDGMSVELEHFRDGLQVVNLTLQSERMSPVAAVDRLNSEITNREQILDTREQDTLEKYLLGEVAEGLRNGMRMAAELVGVMTDEVSKRPMKTGMQMRFKWRRDEDGPIGLQEACEILETDSSTWSTDEREQIKQFLQRSIRDQRDSEQVGSWHEHMRAALDYRLWHRIIIERRSGPDANWQRLTRRTYGSGSGGEKAIALTLPQLAAAAAYYHSADKLAPRFILLDEAFAGISSDMRESCMELISAFKLDVVMTSESEWGMYAGVKQLAICQLDRFADINAVVNRVFIWNGSELRESMSKAEAKEIANQPLFEQE